MSNGSSGSSGSKKKKEEEEQKLPAAVEVPGQPGVPGQPTAVVPPPVTVTPATPAAVAAPLLTAAPPDVSGPTAPINTPNPLLSKPISFADPKLQMAQRSLEASANAYRALPVNATPEQRASAKQEYSSALSQKATLGPSPATVSQAFGMPQREVSPAEQARIAHYNEYLGAKKGINPFTIGSAEMLTGGPGKVAGAGGLAVLTPEEEQVAKRAVKEAADEYRAMVKDERQMRTQLQKSATADERAKWRDLHADRLQYGIESGLVDPRNPTAGLNVDNAYRKALANRRLLKDQSSLSALAEKEITKGSKEIQEKKERAQAVAQQKPSEKTREATEKTELAEMADLNRIRQEEWLEDQRRRQAAIMGHYATPAYAVR